MSAIIIDGRKVRNAAQERLSKEIQILGISPHLVIIQAGENEESNAYVRQKMLFGKSIGATVSHEKINDSEKTERKIIELVEKCNKRDDVHGIIIQLPLPGSVNKDKVFSLISPAKDVDGLHKENLGLLIQGVPRFVPATARGIFSLLDFYKISIEGKKVTVIGRSNLVGKPVALLALSRNATVTVCHSKTENLSSHTKTADILIVAIGKRDLIGKEHVSPGQIIVDVGINVSIENGNKVLHGDVNFNKVSEIVRAITPVPGGVGPMTVVSLFENLLDALKVR